MDKEKFLIINGGSSSLKLSVYEVENENYTELVNAYVERIGQKDSFYTLKMNGEKIEKVVLINDHSEAVKIMLEELLNYRIVNSLDEIVGVGHRVLHGGEIYNDSVIIDETVLNDIESLTKLGPLHHPGEIAGIKGLIKYLPNVKQVAVFDTAFHQTMPKENFLYPVPYQWYEENGVRKYGFHGTSHKYITTQIQKLLNKDDVNLIICHIGSGASISCVKDGYSYNTTMGLTPLDGLMMGTRAGSIDPSIIEYICHERNLSVEEVTSQLNKQSGLLGICGKSDCRDLLKLVEEKDEQGTLTLKMFEKSIMKYIAQYYVELGGKIDGLVFTAGIGENNPQIRKEIIEALSGAFDIHTNNEINEQIYKNSELAGGIITTPESKFPVYVIRTNEEFMIINDTVRVIKNEQKGIQKKLIHDNK